MTITRSDIIIAAAHATNAMLEMTGLDAAGQANALLTALCSLIMEQEDPDGTAQLTARMLIDAVAAVRNQERQEAAALRN